MGLSSSPNWYDFCLCTSCWLYNFFLDWRCLSLEVPHNLELAGWCVLSHMVALRGILQFLNSFFVNIWSQWRLNLWYLCFPLWDDPSTSWVYFTGHDSPLEGQQCALNKHCFLVSSKWEFLQRTWLFSFCTNSIHMVTFFLLYLMFSLFWDLFQFGYVRGGLFLSVARANTLLKTRNFKKGQRGPWKMKRSLRNKECIIENTEEWAHTDAHGK